MKSSQNINSNSLEEFNPLLLIANQSVQQLLLLANQAIINTRLIIPFENSATQPEIKDLKKIKSIYKKIEKLRYKKTNFKDSFYYYLLSNNDPAIIELKTCNKKSKIHHYGNCGEMAYLVVRFLEKNNINGEIFRIEIFAFDRDTGDHTFVVVNRALNSDINVPTTWGGESCIIIDALMRKTYTASKVFEELQCYNYHLSDSDSETDEDNIKENKDPHKLTPYDNEPFEVLLEITFDHNAQYITERLIQTSKKLDNILHSLKEHTSPHNQYEEIIKLIKDYQSETYHINDFTNPDIDRMLDKKIRTIVKKLFECTKDKRIMTDIIINMSSFFNSSSDYFFHLLQFEPVFCHVLNSLKINPIPLSYALQNNIVVKNHENKKLVDALLDKAIKRRKAKAIVALLKSGANPLLKEFQEESTILHWAILYDINVVTKQLLTRHDILPFINSYNSYGCTPLDHAVSWNNIEIVELLLKLGANPKNPSKFYYTALHSAASKGNLEIAKLILKYDDSLINVRDDSGLTPGDHVSSDNPELFTLLNPNQYPRKKQRKSFYAKFFDVQFNNTQNNIKSTVEDSNTQEEEQDNASAYYRINPTDYDYHPDSYYNFQLKF